jgi:divalent metal cation (Fe/Co/Zn/Cd) transporter
LTHLGALAVAGLVGFVGNELAARGRLRGGDRLGSATLIADGHHARVDGLVSLGVVVSAGLVAAGVDVADPLVGLAITGLILRVTVQAWRTIRADRSLLTPAVPGLGFGAWIVTMAVVEIPRRPCREP